jgi:membrane protease YdiL (CAAX protease family)
VAALVLSLVLGVLVVIAGGRLTLSDGALLFELSFISTLLPLWRRGRLSAKDLGLRLVPGARATGLVFLALIAYFVFSGVWSSGLHVPHTTSNFTGVSHQSLGEILIAGFVASIGAPVAEEVFFRGFLYRSLRNRLSVLPACLLAATMFGLLHTQYPLAVRPILVFFGIVTCLLYERTGSLLPGIALHCIVDAGGFEYALTGKETVVVSLFMLLALVLLVRPPLRAIVRRLSGKPAFRELRGETSLDGDGPPMLLGAEHDARHNPFALTEDGRWSPGDRLRGYVLAAALALTALALLGSGSDVFSTRSTGANTAVGAQEDRANGECEGAVDDRLAETGLAGIIRLHARLRALMDEVPGRTYEYGTVDLSDMWSDNAPMSFRYTRLAHAAWPASYEIRRFAADGDDVVADVLELPTSAQAAQLLAQVTRVRCRLDGRVSPADAPPGTWNLVWMNPDGYTQQDAFLARGDLVYRVTDVRAPRSGMSPTTQERQVFALVDRLACALPGAGCARDRGSGATGPSPTKL